MLNSPYVIYVLFAVALLCGIIALWLFAARIGLQNRYRELDADYQRTSSNLQQSTLALDTLSEQNSAQSTQLQSLNTALAVAETRLQNESELREKSQTDTADLQLKLDAKIAELQKAQSELTHLRNSSDEKIKILADAKTQLTQQFEQLASKIFDDKQRRFQESSTANLEHSLKPFRDQLSEFRQRVDAIHSQETEQRGELRQQLKTLQQMNDSIGREAQNLTRALKGDNKAQGNWGEVILERVLEESGLRKGHEYDTQLSFSDNEGKRRQPDVVVRLPDNKDIIIDAKVSLIAYERYCSSDNDAERSAALRDHIASVKSHISSLSTKAYEHIDGLRTLDFVFIFIPIESAFMAAFESDPDMFRHAYEQNIIVVGPTTLLATLRTVQSIWRHERQNQNAEKIARQAGSLHDQFALVLESLQELGKQIGRSQEAYEKTVDRLSRGRGNLIGRIDRLQDLGAKVKKTLPAGMLERADDSGSTEDSDS